MSALARSQAKGRRLSRSSEFQRVYRQGRSKANRYLVLYSFARGEGEAAQPRFGVSVGRKVGNLQDFVTNWGGRYDFMVVLDADSILAPDTLVTLVRDGRSLKGFAFSTLERIGGTPSVLIGLASIVRKRAPRRRASWTRTATRAV